MKNTVCAACLLGLLAADGAHAYDGGDWQAWVNVNAGAPVVGDLSVRIEEETRLGDGASDYYEQHVLLLLDYRVTDWFQVAMGEREVFSLANQTIYTAVKKDGQTTYSRKADHYWKREDRPTFDLVFRLPLGKWAFDDRVRIEYRAKDGEDPYFRYRNRIRAKSPWKWTSRAVNPYVAWEANYSDKTDDAQWDRHRFYGGVNAKLTERIKAEAYYCLQHDRQAGGWRDYNVAGLAVGMGY